jgi:hypothetical protein
MAQSIGTIIRPSRRRIAIAMDGTASDIDRSMLEHRGAAIMDDAAMDHEIHDTGGHAPPVITESARVAQPFGEAAAAQSTSALQDLAARLTPNPALTVAGTLAMILDGIDRLDDEQLARTLGYVVARNPGDFDESGKAMDVEPMTDEQWLNADPVSKRQLILTAKAVKIALRHMTQ